MGYFSSTLNNMEVSTSMEKIILQNARESKTANYPVQESETAGCCFDNLNSALSSLIQPISNWSIHIFFFFAILPL